MGTSSELSFVSDAKAERYINGFPTHQRIDICNLFPNANEDALDLLRKMLEINPYYRITAKEALRHKYFTKIRNKSQEIERKEAITLISDKFAETGNLVSSAKEALYKIITKAKH